MLRLVSFLAVVAFSGCGSLPICQGVVSDPPVLCKTASGAACTHDGHQCYVCGGPITASEPCVANGSNGGGFDRDVVCVDSLRDNPCGYCCD